MEQDNGTEVDVQVQFESQTEQNVSGMLVPGHSGIAEGTQKDCVDVIAQRVEGSIRQRFFRLEVMMC